MNLRSDFEEARRCCQLAILHARWRPPVWDYLPVIVTVDA